MLLIVALATGSDLANATDDLLPLVFLLATLAALGALAAERRSAAARIDAAESERERLANERDRLASELSESERREREAEERRSQAEAEARGEREAAGRERELRARVDRARRMEREWARELREQLAHAHVERGTLGDPGDVRDQVLRVSMTLLEAEKGLLLSREQEDGDGRLPVVAHAGFHSDPSDSAVARRFAERVIAADEMVREDDTADLGETRSPADEEIESLVAIPIYIQDDFSGVVVCANRDGGFEELDDDVLLALGDHAGAALHNSRLHGELRTSYLATVRMLADAVEAKDPFLAGHSEQVSAYVSAVAERLGLDRRRREELVFGSLLHDVGKIGISERILLKPGPLTPQERGIVELHPKIGSRLVERVPALRALRGAILHHHERWDGSGYPAGLKGEEIPLDARVVGVVDAFSAMISDRSYRERMTVAEACSELEREAGAHFDPKVVRLFVEEVRRRPPITDGQRSLAAALEEPELEARREAGEPLLGARPARLTDSLTLLYSRSYLHEVAAAEAERAHVQDRGFAVVLIELTEVEAINRRDGYAAGDAELERAARVVERAVAPTGAIACRFGGRRLALLVRQGEGLAPEQLVRDVSAELQAAGILTRAAMALWRQDASGEDVIAEARVALDALSKV